MIDDDELLCPLCVEEIDPVDKYFFPCPCGYQICRFCWNHIRESLNNLCPACRREFDDTSVQFDPPSTDEISRIQSERKRRKQGQRRSHTGYLAVDGDRSMLKDVKVFQRTLVYVTNMPPKYAVEDILMGDSYFGQFGRILKLSISRRPPNTQGGRTGENQIGVHITFSSHHDAIKCIQFVDGAQIENRTLHATYGQTKYCALWLQHRPCSTANCMFLHDAVDGEATLPVPKLPVNQGPRYFGPRGRRQQQLQPFSPQSTGGNSNSPSAGRSSSGNDLDVGSEGATALPASANWATRKPDLTSNVPTRPPTSSVAAFDNTPTSAPAVKALSPRMPSPSVQEGKAKSQSDTKDSHRASRDAAAARMKEESDVSVRRSSIDSKLNKRPSTHDPEANKNQTPASFVFNRSDYNASNPTTDSSSDIVHLPPFDLASRVLGVIQDSIPIPDRVTVLSASAPNKTVAQYTQSKVHSILNLVPNWILSSTRVILSALDVAARLSTPTVYTGTFSPFDTGDLMTDILNEKTQTVAARSLMPESSHILRSGSASVYDASVQPSTPLSSGQFRTSLPLSSTPQQYASGVASELSAGSPGNPLLLRQRIMASDNAKHFNPPPPCLTHSQNSYGSNTLPFSDPAIMAFRLSDQHSNTASSKDISGQAVLQQLHETLAAKQVNANVQASGPPPGFNAPLKAHPQVGHHDASLPPFTSPGFPSSSRLQPVSNGNNIGTLGMIPFH